MRRLLGEDAGFLALETPIQPMNTMALALLGATPAPVTVDYVRRHMVRRLGQVPAFRWRVEPVPFGIHHPVYVEDRSFDIEEHVSQVILRPPGGPVQLVRLSAALAEQRLDRRRPLWQLTLVNGLADGRQAVVLRFHHCLMDGFATVNALSRIFTDDHHREPPPAPSQPPPRAPRLLAAAARDQAAAHRRLPALVSTTWRNVAALKADHPAPHVPGSRDAPASIINRASTSDRRFALAALPIDDVKVVRKAAGVSVNDVALAVVAGALRSYLEARNQLPARPLIASVPVGMEAAGAPPRTYGNRFSSLTTSLATDVDDPWARLRVISEVTAEAKRRLNILGPQLLPDWLEFVPPAVAERAVRRDVRRRRRHPDKADVNIVVSNVRGPAEPWSFGPAVVEEMYLTGPPNNGVGANIVLWDYAGRLRFGILTFADSIEAPDQLAEGLHRSLAELVLAAATPEAR